MYDASDERVARIPSTNTPWTVTLRDEGSHLASEYSLTSSGYAQSKDYYNFGNQLVTTLDWVTVNALYWVDDHLGTPRYGDETIGGHETHDYQPFGQEIGGSFGAQPLKFASMERDQSSGNDYDHARYDLTGVGRFLGVDKAAGRTLDPLTWNRYAYAVGNPLKFVDPNGKDAYVFIVSRQLGTSWKSTFGHAALYVTTPKGNAGVSFGGDAAFEKGIRGFVSKYNSEGRTVTEFKLKTTPAEDERMRMFLTTGDTRHTYGLDPKGYFINNNCSTAVCNTLKSGGVLPPGSDPASAFGIVDTPEALENSLRNGELRGDVSGITTFDPSGTPSGLSDYVQGVTDIYSSIFGEGYQGLFGLQGGVPIY